MKITFTSLKALGNYRYKMPGSSLKEIRTFLRHLDPRVVVEFNRNGEKIFNTRGSGSKSLRDCGFSEGSWLLFNRPDIVADVSTVVLNDKEYESCFSNGFNVGVISPSGLSVAVREPGGLPYQWQRDRALVFEWSKLDQAMQYAPYFQGIIPDSNYSSIWRAQGVIMDNFAQPNHSFTIKAPDRWREPKALGTRTDTSLRIYFFTWPDICRLALMDEVDFNIAQDWSSIWQGLFNPVEPMSQQMPLPRVPLIRPTMRQHDGVAEAIRKYKDDGGMGKVLVLLYDSHHDRGYGSAQKIKQCGYSNWAKYVEQQGWARVVHIPTYFNDNGGLSAQRSSINWNTPARRASILKEIQAILSGEPISQVWLTPDYDAFSLNAGMVNRHSQRVFHLSPSEVEAELSALKMFLNGIDIGLHRILPCSSQATDFHPGYLNLRRIDQPAYVSQVDGILQRVFGS